MWFLLIPAALVGYAVRLLVEPEKKSEVISYTTNNAVIDVSEQALKSVGIDYEVDTDGVNSWIMVAPSKRVDATKAISIAATTSRAKGVNRATELPSISTE